MFKKLAKALALNKIEEAFTATKHIPVLVQDKINAWAMAEYGVGTSAFSERGELQPGFKPRGWSWPDKRYFWMDYFVDGVKVATSRWSNVTGNRKK